MLHSYDDHAFCPSQKETANNVLEKLSAPKPLCGKWFPKDDTKQMANASHIKWPDVYCDVKLSKLH